MSTDILRQGAAAIFEHWQRKVFDSVGKFTSTGRIG
jgi:hypothetical protein